VTLYQSPPYLPRQLWYFIASICGATFTYVLAPLVLDVLRRLLKNRRLRRSRAVRTLLPSAAQRGGDRNRGAFTGRRGFQSEQVPSAHPH
jgi:hypothetical protein